MVAGLLEEIPLKCPRGPEQEAVENLRHSRFLEDIFSQHAQILAIGLP